MTAFSEISTNDPELETLISKVSRGERLSREEGLVLERTRDIHALCRLADLVRERLHGNRVGYIVNAHLDYTNVCIMGCRFCMFSRKPDDAGTYTVDPSEAAGLIKNDVDEIHVVGGVNPNLSLGYFVDLVTALHGAFPRATIKAFTAIELIAITDREGIPVADILATLKNAGLGMLPGGGAEIFAPEVRTRVCPNKATADQWLEVHRIAHQMGIPSNSTMLYGHVEKPEHLVDHLLRLRHLQDETGGFVAHVPLPYLSGGNELFSDIIPPNGALDIRQIALARLMLENIPHIKAYWRALGLKTAQVALRSGADDLEGTIGRERVMESAGTDAPSSLSVHSLESLIRQAGLEPYRRDSFHRPLEGSS